jgi:hypothetical protein
LTSPEKITGRLSILLLLLLLAGCEEINDRHPMVIFQYHYTNHAWGYQDSGFIIDTAGKLRSFSMPAVWNYPDTNGYISATEMEENLAQLGENECTVNMYDIAFFAGKLRKAQDGKISEPEHRMCDAGSHSYGGYIFEPGRNRYKYVFLKLTGDFYKENQAREADDIYEWLTNPCETQISVRGW